MLSREKIRWSWLGDVHAVLYTTRRNLCCRRHDFRRWRFSPTDPGEVRDWYPKEYSGTGGLPVWHGIILCHNCFQRSFKCRVV